MLKRVGIIAVLGLIVGLLTAIPAFAVAPTDITRTGGLHFVGQPTVTATKDGTAFLSTSGEVAGAGTQATALLTATAEVTQGCITRGGGEPRGLQRITTTVTGSETFETRQGRGTFAVTTNEITAPSGGFTCPSAQQTPVLVSVTFTDITLTVTSQTGTTTAFFADIDP